MSKTITIKSGQKTITNRHLHESGRKYQVELLEEADIPALLELERRCFDPKLYDELLTEKAVRNLLTKGNAVILICRVDGRVGGYAQVTFKSNSDKARFYSLAVHPDHQGSGIGGQLFAAVEKLCVALGIAHLILEIREDNHVLKARYEKKGYRVYRRVPDYYADKAAALKMTRPVEK